MAAAGRIPPAGAMNDDRASGYSCPRLAAGCRWGSHGDEPVILYPEGMIRLQDTGRSILELCDGKRSLQEIVSSLALRFTKADAEKIRSDVQAFLESLQQKRIVDY